MFIYVENRKNLPNIGLVNADFSVEIKFPSSPTKLGINLCWIFWRLYPLQPKPNGPLLCSVSIPFHFTSCIEILWGGLVLQRDASLFYQTTAIHKKVKGRRYFCFNWLGTQCGKEFTLRFLTLSFVSSACFLCCVVSSNVASPCC